MGQVVWTAEAERWLSEIHDYIAAGLRGAVQGSARRGGADYGV